ncbi:MAG: flagellin [Lachnospiraceae bacterium]|nr:flagellin [Lachnospiraceae bacterium]
MGMVVQHNMSAMNANRNLGVTAGNLAKSTEKLSSGYKINRAGDNAAGLAISEKMRGQIRGLDQASSNAEDGISMIQTAEGALTETHSIIQRMRELAVQASSDTNTDDDRTQIQNEIDQLTQEVDRIANTTEFNTKKLLDGSRKGAVSEKDGSLGVEGNFSNSNVSAEITTNHGDKSKFTDAIRIEINSDFDKLDATNALDATNTDIDAYVELKEKKAKLNAGVKTVQGDGANTGVTDTLVRAYVDATKAALKGGTTGLNTAQTNAWTALTAATAKMTGTGTANLGADGTTAITSASTKADLDSALKDTLDQIAKNEVELETSDANKAISGTKVIKTSDKTKVEAGDLIDTASDTSADYAATKDKVTASGLAGAAAANTAADAYKTAYKDALASGLTADKAKESDAVVAARNSLYDAFKADLKDTNATTGTGTIDFGSEGTVTLGTTKKDATAGMAFDALVSAAEADATAQLDKENAIAELKGKSATGVGIGADAYTVTDLFGNGTNGNTTIAGKLDSDNNLTISIKNKSGEDTVITVKNADKLKAGDTVTITSQEMVETEPAATGKEAFRLQVGANAGQEVSLGINSMKSKDLNIVQTKAGKEGLALDVTSQTSASLAVEAYDMAIQKVSTERAKMGATQNRLEHTISNLDTSSENLQSAESSLRDTDMAEEMTRYSKNNILMQAGQSMLAQANQSTQGVLNLLG